MQHHRAHVRPAAASRIHFSMHILLCHTDQLAPVEYDSTNGGLFIHKRPWLMLKYYLFIVQQ
jgi:hypothetical protein